jgi:hypothetical protein
MLAKVALTDRRSGAQLLRLPTDARELLRCKVDAGMFELAVDQPTDAVEAAAALARQLGDLEKAANILAHGAEKVGGEKLAELVRQKALAQSLTGEQRLEGQVLKERAGAAELRRQLEALQGGAQPKAEINGMPSAEPKDTRKLEPVPEPAPAPEAVPEQPQAQPDEAEPKASSAVPQPDQQASRPGLPPLPAGLNWP